MILLYTVEDEESDDLGSFIKIHNSAHDHINKYNRKFSDCQIQTRSPRAVQHTRWEGAALPIRLLYYPTHHASPSLRFCSFPNSIWECQEQASPDAGISFVAMTHSPLPTFMGEGEAEGLRVIPSQVAMTAMHSQPSQGQEKGNLPPCNFSVEGYLSLGKPCEGSGTRLGRQRLTFILGHTILRLVISYPLKSVTGMTKCFPEFSSTSD